MTEASTKNVYEELREFSRRLDAERASKGLPPLVFVTAVQQPPQYSYVHMPKRRQEENKQRPLQQREPDLIIIDYISLLPKVPS